jgi:hypothetical protein
MGTPKLPVRTCACGCRKTFRPHVRTEKYLNAKHRNRAGQARLRERAKRDTAAQVTRDFSLAGEGVTNG